MAIMDWPSRAVRNAAVYRGLLRKLAGATGYTKAILGGKDGVVHDAILCDSHRPA